MMWKILRLILHRQEDYRVVAQFKTETLHARVFQMRERQGCVEYWIDVRWNIDGKESSSYGLLRRTAHDDSFDVMHEAQKFLQTPPR